MAALSGRASAFTCVCVAWLERVELQKEQQSWIGTACIEGDDVEHQNNRTLELPAG